MPVFMSMRPLVVYQLWGLFFGGLLLEVLLRIEEPRDIEQEWRQFLSQVHLRDLIGHQLFLGMDLSEG